VAPQGASAIARSLKESGAGMVLISRLILLNSTTPASAGFAAEAFPSSTEEGSLPGYFSERFCTDGPDPPLLAWCEMKILFFIGLVVLILGIVSLVVPIPRSERDGVTVGGVSFGVETRHEEKLSPALSAVMILGGIGAMAAGRGRSSRANQ
jgi:hypothetical protein